MPPPPVPELVWKALADHSRRAILVLLRDHPRTTGDLAGAFPELTRFAVMKHLGVLEQAELVVVRRRGRERWNYLNGVPLRAAYERWMRPYADQWADSLLRLKDTVEQPEKGSAMSTTTALQLSSLDIAQETRVAAPREKVFDALCKMGEWWPHRFREESQVHFDATVGGRFWEEWPDGGAIYATVDKLRRPELLECTGPMGMDGPILGTFTLTLEEDGTEATLLKLTHRAYGDIDEETRTGYTQGWGAIVEVLRSYLGIAS